MLCCCDCQFGVCVGAVVWIGVLCEGSLLTFVVNADCVLICRVAVEGRNEE